MPQHPAHMMLLVYFQQGGIAMYPLVLASVLSLGIALERIRHLSRASKQDAALLAKLEPLVAAGKTTEIAKCCDGAASPLARLLQVGLTPMRGRPAAREKAMERALTRETNGLERYLSVLATIGSVSPFVGLFGTVLGIMRAFRDMGLAGSAGGAIVAAGIAEALITTAAGLIVAVIAVVAYNHLMTWAQSIGTAAELNAEDVLARLDEGAA